EIVPSVDDVRFDLVFTGTCRSETDGVNTFVVLRNSAETQFLARKQFVWNRQGLSSFPTVAAAETRSTTKRIDTPLPGVIGYVAREIAVQRAADVRPQADAIAAQHAAKRIEREVDGRIEGSLAVVGRLAHYLQAGGAAHRPMRLKFSCNGDALQLLVSRRDAPQLTGLPENHPLASDCDVSIRVHRGVLQPLLRDPRALLLLAVIADRIVLADEPPHFAVAGDRPGDPVVRPWRFSHSSDGTWFVVEHLRQPSPQPVLSTGIPLPQTSR
ncbi:MAG TPA: hypothetical protein VMF30_06525, partial [Pirellulales bacterium]|nr:hypothetical protein [Pirellulales bacterium]